MQDYGNSSVLAMELPEFRAKPSIYSKEANMADSSGTRALIQY